MTLRFVPEFTGNKKYSVYIPADLWNAARDDNRTTEKRIRFGDKRYSHYKDVVGFYNEQDHLDDKRRNLYRIRHSKIKNAKGEIAYKVKYSPAWFSWHYLW